MSEKSNSLLCWCCKNFLVRFDSDINPNKITGGVCINKRKECKPYTEICDKFSLKKELLPEYNNSPHSVEEYIKRNPEFIFCDGNFPNKR